MSTHRILLFASVLTLLVPRANGQTYHVEPAFTSLSFQKPVDLQSSRDGTNRLFVVEQPGVIRVFENNPSATSSSVFLDISGRVFDGGGEEGLLGLAFDPDYSSNGYFYVYYTANSPKRSVISRFSVDAGNPDLGDDGSELVILEFDQPNTNHNGGQLRFGPDNYLYIGVGDGGGSGDPDENGQDRRTLLGNILRLDVSAAAPGSPYTIPADNPFVGNTDDYREEIYAWGLRNPWRFSFDSGTGDLWVGDVGQGRLEEIDIVEKGKNYGWNTMEASLCFDPMNGCNQANLELPIFEYNRDNDDKSITGGFVYHGQQLQGLVGKYIYGDFVSSRIWALEFNNGVAINNTLLVDEGFGVAAFATDDDDELLICGYNGTIYKLIETSTATDPQFVTGVNISIYPNPFQNDVMLEIESETSASVTVDVYDILGRHVLQLADGLPVSGKAQVTWEAKDSEGSSVAPGAYLIRISTQDGATTRVVVSL